MRVQAINSVWLECHVYTVKVVGSNPALPTLRKRLMKKPFKISTSPVLRYPGGKFRARNNLESFIPENTKNVISPFLGGGSFELHLTKRKINIYAYDAFTPLVDFWKVLLSQPEELFNQVESYGDISKEKFYQFKKEITENTISSNQVIEKAAKFFVVNRCSFSGATLSGGYSKDSAKTRFTKSSRDKLKYFYNPYLKVEEKDFSISLKTTNLESKNIDLIFLDPPYLLDKSKNILYGIGGSHHKDFDHLKLKTILSKIDTPFMLTYNDTDTVREMYKDFNIVSLSWSYGMNSSKKSSEILITNFK